MSRQRKTLKEKILAVLGDVSYMTTREVATAVRVPMDDIMSVRMLLEILAEDGLVEKKSQPLTDTEREEKVLKYEHLFKSESHKEAFKHLLKERWVWKRI